MRDNNKCMECGKSNCMLEVHHVVPKRSKGSNNLGNLITLCSSCHDKTEHREEQFINHYQSMIDGKNIRFDYAQHVMQGKTWLRNKLSELGNVTLTNGGDTANKRIDWDIEKTHSNDAIVITDLEVNSDICDIKDWVIKPMRRQSEAKVEELKGFKHRDLIKYTKRNGDSYVGYVTSLIPLQNQLSFTTLDNRVMKRYGIKPCKLLWRFNKMYWF